MSTPPPVAQVTVDHDDPWKEDGNIVLAAEGKYFCVHRSVLSAYSEVFRDMFDCLHQNEGEELIEDSPVVYLHDAATDVQIILRAMYDRSCPVPCYEKMHFSVVSAFLRLGEKYAISALVKEAKARLHCPYDPTSMDGVTAMTLPSDLFPAITGGDPHNFQIMNLLQEMGLKAPLPMAMYQCIVTCPLRAVVDGYKDKDSFHSLSHTNLRSFIMMKDVLENSRIRLAKSLCKASVQACTQTSVCTTNTRQLVSDSLSDSPSLSRWKRGWDKLFCESCKTSLKAKREGEMTQAWSQIPTAFGFTSWEEVRKSGDFPSITIRAC